jgi:hypothetical protein
MMMRVNGPIRAVLHTDPGSHVPFFCECDLADCDLPVWLSLAGYDRVAATANPITARAAPLLIRAAS